MGNYLQVAIPGGNVVAEARGRVRSWYGDDINIPNSAACKSAGVCHQLSFMSRPQVCAGTPEGRKVRLAVRRKKRRPTVFMLANPSDPASDHYQL